MGWLNRAADKIKGGQPPRERLTQPQPASEISRQAAILFPDLPQAESERRLADAYAYLMADGMDLEARIITEVQILSELEPEDLADRFEHTPLPRVDAFPEDPVKILEWLEDVLRSEHHDLTSGRIPYAHALKIASFPRGEVPSHLSGTIPQVQVGPQRFSDEEVEIQAGQILRMPTKFLRHRFRQVPGVEDADIPDEYRTEERMDWIVAALRAEETRQLCQLTDPRHEGGEWTAGLQIDFVDINLEATDNGLLAFSGNLYVEGERLCLLVSPGDGSYSCSQFAPGVTDEDVTALDAYISAFGEMRQGEEQIRPTFLMDLLLDRVLAHCTIVRYRAAAQNSILFCPDISAENPEIFMIEIPEGGSREDASTAVRVNYPEAILLDDMKEMDAALLWATLT